MIQNAQILSLIWSLIDLRLTQGSSVLSCICAHTNAIFASLCLCSFLIHLHLCLDSSVWSVNTRSKIIILFSLFTRCSLFTHFEATHFFNMINSDPIGLDSVVFSSEIWTCKSHSEFVFIVSVLFVFFRLFQPCLLVTMLVTKPNKKS